MSEGWLGRAADAVAPRRDRRPGKDGPVPTRERNPRLGLTRAELTDLRDNPPARAQEPEPKAMLADEVAQWSLEYRIGSALQIYHVAADEWKAVRLFSGNVGHPHTVTFEDGSDPIQLQPHMLIEVRQLVPYIQTGLSGGSIAVTSLRQYPDGRRVVVKRAGLSDSDAEYLASRIGEALGAPVPAVIRTDDDREIWMSAVDGESGISAARAIVPGGSRTAAYPVTETWEEQWANGEPGWRIGLMDAMVDNHDRHPGNWMIDPDFSDEDQVREDSIVGIDHGNAWVLSPDPNRVSGDTPPGWITTSSYPPSQAIVSGDGWDTDWLSLAEADQIDRRLRALEPEFERSGRMDWYDYAMAVWGSYYRAVQHAALAEPTPAGSMADDPMRYVGRAIRSPQGKWMRIQAVERFRDANNGEWVRVDTDGQRFNTRPGQSLQIAPYIHDQDDIDG